MLLKGLLNNFNTDRQQQLYSNSLSTFFFGAATIFILICLRGTTKTFNHEPAYC
jgi:hypothetical protein